MTWHYLPDLFTNLPSLPAQAVDSSALPCSVGIPSAPSRSTPIAAKSCFGGNETVCSPCSLSGMTCEISEANPGVERWISLQADFHANPFPEQASGSGLRTKETAGRIPFAYFEQSSHGALSLRMSQGSLLPDTSEPSSETWPPAGMMHAGKLYPRNPSAPPISGNDSGFWPTPNVSGGGNPPEGLTPKGNHFVRPSGKKAHLALDRAVKLWPTPTIQGNHNRAGLSATSGDGLSTAVKSWPTPVAAGAERGGRGDLLMVVRGHTSPSDHYKTSPQQVQEGIAAQHGALNPAWVCWLMGWPAFWTSLEPLARAAFDAWMIESCDGTWFVDEHGIPRVNKGEPHRVQQLRALGNGQVPLCFVAAYRQLTADAPLFAGLE